jgi:hypothetical protein
MLRAIAFGLVGSALTHPFNSPALSSALATTQAYADGTSKRIKLAECPRQWSKKLGTATGGLRAPISKHSFPRTPFGRAYPFTKSCEVLSEKNTINMRPSSPAGSRHGAREGLCTSRVARSLKR